MSPQAYKQWSQLTLDWSFCIREQKNNPVLISVYFSRSFVTEVENKQTEIELCLQKPLHCAVTACKATALGWLDSHLLSIHLSHSSVDTLSRLAVSPYSPNDRMYPCSPRALTFPISASCRLWIHLWGRHWILWELLAWVFQDTSVTTFFLA